MDCIYIAPLSKVLYNLCLSFTHSHTHSHTNGDWLPCKAPTSSSGAIGGSVSCSGDTSTRPGRDRTGNPPTARRLLLPPEPHRPHNQAALYFLRDQRRYRPRLTLLMTAASSLISLFIPLKALRGFSKRSC